MAIDRDTLRGQVQTVSGLIAPDALGRVLMPWGAGDARFCGKKEPAGRRPSA